MTKELNNEEMDPVTTVLVLSATVMVAAVIGALIGFSLSFTTLSPLVIGGIMGCALYAVITGVSCGSYPFTQDKKIQDNCKNSIFFFSKATIATAVAGVAFGAAADFLFPGVMSSAWSATLIGAAIGVLGTASALLAAVYIIEPVVEKVADAFRGESAC